MSSTPSTPVSTISAPVRETSAGRELDLFAFVLLLLRNLKLIVGCGLLAFLAMVVVMLRTKPRFSSTATMIVPQGNITTAKIAEQLSATTADLLGGGFELYGDILQSRVVADALIRDYDLQAAYHAKDLPSAEQTLAALTKVQTEREGLIRVTVQDTDARRAADLANDYLRQLDLLNSKLVLTTVGQQRAYLERELVKEKNALADAEVALKQVQESTSGVTPDAQAAVGLTALETTRAELRAAQIQLAALRTSETEENPEIVRLRAQIASLSAQVDSLERGVPGTANGTPISKVPAEALEYVRRKRDVTFHETLFELLEKQYETAKQEEAKNPSIVQVLDTAIPSIHKAWPPRTFYCGLALIVGMVLGVVLVGMREFAYAYMRNPANAANLHQLRLLWARGPRA